MGQQLSPDQSRKITRLPPPDGVLAKDRAPVHSFHTLLRYLRTIVKDRIRLKAHAAIEFDKITTPTPLQQRALDLLRVSLSL